MLRSHTTLLGTTQNLVVAGFVAESLKKATEAHESFALLHALRPIGLFEMKFGAGSERLCYRHH